MLLVNCYLHCWYIIYSVTGKFFTSVCGWFCDWRGGAFSQFRFCYNFSHQGDNCNMEMNCWSRGMLIYAMGRVCVIVDDFGIECCLVSRSRILFAVFGVANEVANDLFVGKTLLYTSIECS